MNLKKPRVIGIFLWVRQYGLSPKSSKAKIKGAKSVMEKITMTEQIKALLSDTSGIAGSPEERAKWKKYFEDQNELAKEVASQIETEKDKMTDQKNSTWLSKIKDVLRKILADTHGECNIPENVIRDLAKALLPNILAFFESEEGKREFDAWKKQREQATEKVNTNAKESEA